jgi:hypothetical protein
MARIAYALSPPVILKIKWRRILNIIRRMQLSRVGPSLGVSATFDQSSYLAIRPVCHRRRGIR